MTTDKKTLDNARQYCATLALRKITEEGALLVDIREPSEVATVSFDVAHVITLPMSELELRFTELPRDQELILACSSGGRSLKATYFLMYHGYDKVANLEDGLAKWARKGFPVQGDVASLTQNSNCCSSTTASCCTPSPSTGTCC